MTKTPEYIFYLKRDLDILSSAVNDSTLGGYVIDQTNMYQGEILVIMRRCRTCKGNSNSLAVCCQCNGEGN